MDTVLTKKNEAFFLVGATETILNCQRPRKSGETQKKRSNGISQVLADEQPDRKSVFKKKTFVLYFYEKKEKRGEFGKPFLVSAWVGCWMRLQ